MNSANQFLLTILAYAVPILTAIMLREIFHAHVARRFGDNRLAAAGRLSFNPLNHIDPFGTVLLPLLLAYFGMMPFGYAKQLPREAMRPGEVYPHMTVIALSGPLANFIMGVGWAVYLLALIASGNVNEFLLLMGKIGMGVNAAMIVFNMLPFPPFDGGRAIAGLLPLAPARRFMQIEYYSLYIVIAILVVLQFGIFNRAFAYVLNAVSSVFVLLVRPFFSI